MKIKIKKLYSDTKEPYRAYKDDAGLDLFVHSMEFVDNDKVRYGLGVGVEIPQGYVGLLFPRSSIKDKSLRLTNSVGVIDAGYRGEIKAVFDIIGSGKIYALGEKCCQLVVVPILTDYEIVDDLPDSERGSNGFGSSN